VRADRFESVGSWFLETNEFRGWTSGGGGADKAVFCYGNPGAGKTFKVSDQPFGRNRSYH